MKTENQKPGQTVVVFDKLSGKIRRVPIDELPELMRKLTAEESYDGGFLQNLLAKVPG